MTAGRRWRNWSGSVESRPRHWFEPVSEDELIAYLASPPAQATPVRVVGSGHSYTPLVATEGTIVSLDRLQGVIDWDLARERATVWGGTKLHALGDPLRERGLALSQQGDADYQSIAGAIGTGTHGTGTTLGSISTDVVGLRLLTAGGQVLECSAEREPDVFRAALVSLGTLGVMTQLTLQLRPAYRLHNVRWNVDLEDALGLFDELNARHRHVEMWWFPHADRAALRTMDPVEDPPKYSRFKRWIDDIVLENAGMWVFGQLTRFFPSLSRPAARLAARIASTSDYVDHSYRVFATGRLVKANEMEYAVAAGDGPDCLRAIRDHVRRHKVPVFFPIEYRYVAADEIPLSPFYKRESAVASVHQFAKSPYREYFGAVEQLFLGHGGRPHWGKHHTLTAERLRPMYPEWTQFHAIRRRLDPDGVFMTPYLREVLGRG